MMLGDRIPDRRRKALALPTLLAVLAGASAAAAVTAQVTAPAAAAEHRLHALADALVESYAPSRDDPDWLCERLIDAAGSAAPSAASALAIEAVGGLIDRLDRPAEIEAALARFEGLRPHALGADAAKVVRARILHRLGRFDEADALCCYDGYATHLIAIGPFGDSGNYFTDVPFPPELDFPDDGVALAGRYGKVASYEVERRPNQRSLSLARPGQDERGCFYGLHQVRSTEPQTGFVELTTRSSFELFVNGRRTFVLDRIAGPAPARQFIPVRLAGGDNHVLVKTTLSESDDVSLRYIDAAGRPLPGVQEIAGARVVPHAETAAEPPPDAPFVDGLRALDTAARTAHGQSAGLLTIASALSDLDQTEVDRGLRTLYGFELSPPDEPRLRVALARALGMAQDLPAEIRNARARRLVESATDALPDHFQVALERVRHLQDEDKQEDAIRLLQQRIEDGAAGPETFSTLHGTLDKLHFRAEAELLVDQWRSRHPLDTRAVLLAARDKSDGGDHRAALAQLLDALERLPGHRGLQQRALELATGLGQKDLAERMLGLLERDDPDGLAALRRRARALRELGEQDSALAAYQQIAEHEAATAGDVRDAGRWLLRGARRARAHTAFDRSLRLDPAQHDLRRLLGRLGRSDDHAGADDVTADEDFPMIAGFRYDGDALIEGFEASERESGSPSTLVLDHMIVRYYPDGSRVEETHAIRRINDLAGVEAHEEARDAAAAGEVVRLRTVGVDGKSYLPQRVAGSFSMPRVQPGAFIEEIHREFVASPGAEPWRGPTFYFQSESEPFLLTELVVILPPDHRGSFRLRNFTGEHEVKQLADGHEGHVFRSKDVPQLKRERLTPPLEDILPIVAYGDDRAAGERARLQRAGAAFRTRSTPQVAAAAREVTSGLDGDSARARALYDFVHREIPDSRGPANPTSILLRKQGPRFFLLLAMLHEAGVPFRFAAAADTPAALSSEPEPFFLGEDDYGIPAALVEPRDGAPFWLFVDAPRYAPMGTISAERAGAAVLLVHPGGHELIRLPGGDLADLGWSLSGEIALDADGHADLDARLELHGEGGYSLAEQIRNLQENRRELVGRSLASQLFPGWTVRSTDLPGVPPGERLQASAVLQKRGALQPAGDDFTLPLPLPPSELFRRFGDRGQRVLPARFTDLDHWSWDVTIDPGEHFKLLSIPDSVRVRHKLLDYTLTYEKIGERLRIRRQVSNRPGRLLPSEFAEWVQLLSRLDKAEEAMIRLGRRHG